MFFPNYALAGSTKDQTGNKGQPDRSPNKIAITLRGLSS